MNINQLDQKSNKDADHQRMTFSTTSLIDSNISYLKIISNSSNTVKMDQLSKSFLIQLNKKLTKQMQTQDLKFITSKMNINRRSRVMFTKEEDEKIIQLVNEFGTHSWSLIASFFHCKSAKQCRDRYTNYLIPGFFRGEWSNEEDELLKKLIKSTGTKWSILQKSFPERSAISIKNRWTYFLSKQNDINENNKQNLDLIKNKKSYFHNEKTEEEYNSINDSFFNDDPFYFENNEDFFFFILIFIIKRILRAKNTLSINHF